MAGISKRVSGSWVSGDYAIMKTATDTLTTLPAVLYPTGTTATVGLKGNTVQSTTPTPQNPVIPESCGELEISGTKAGRYKIPLLSANITTNVYLGEVPTTRKIKKLVLTGEENWWEAPYAPIPSLKRYGLTLSSTVIIGSRDVFCTHYVATTVSNDSIQIGSNMKSLYISDNENGATLSDWKSYLAQQYDTGTPVTVWYVLVTPTTGIVNEPLRKIGDYADEVSSITIPVTAGANTLSVDTTLQPSEVTVNYKGWHPVANVHERNNGAWT